jgi:hypothetical protein
MLHLFSHLPGGVEWTIMIMACTSIHTQAPALTNIICMDKTPCASRLAFSQPLGWLENFVFYVLQSFFFIYKRSIAYMVEQKIDCVTYND